MKNALKILFLISFALLLLWTIKTLKGPQTKTITLPNNDRLTAEVAATDKAKAKGLGGRLSIKPNQAMLFVYETDDEYCMWMKDVSFAIDIIWLNFNKEVVDVEQDVSPGTYPQTFCPDRPARYVLETRAGVAAAARLQIGNSLSF